jgi:hypothetical protein
MNKKIIFATLITLMLCMTLLVSTVSSDNNENDEAIVPLLVQSGSNVGWNLISLPVDKPVEKTSLLVRLNGEDYTWAEAISSNNPTGSPLIISFFYSWDRDSQNYKLVDVLEPGMGYWIIAYTECKLVYQGDLTVDNSFTTLKKEYNIIGLPYNEPVALTDLVINFQGYNLTWEQATTKNNPTGSQIIIPNTVWYFDTVNNKYHAAEVLEPGKGYWMYCYQDDVKLSVGPIEPLDIVPPETEIQFNCEMGQNGWYISDVEVVLIAEDDQSGVAATFYSINRGLEVEYIKPFTIEEDGIFTIRYYSIDNAGNIEKPHKKAPLGIDTEKPRSSAELIGKSPNNEAYKIPMRNVFCSPVEIIISAEDMTSGVQGICYKIDSGKFCRSNDDVVKIIVEEKGKHIIQFYSYDNAGNEEELNRISFYIIPILNDRI